MVRSFIYSLIISLVLSGGSLLNSFVDYFVGSVGWIVLFFCLVNRSVMHSWIISLLLLAEPLDTPFVVFPLHFLRGSLFNAFVVVSVTSLTESLINSQRGSFVDFVGWVVNWFIR